MTFLHTLFLPLLAAASIPVLLHLLSRMRLPVVSFSTLEFLKRLQKKKARRVKLKQLILLIIRTLAIIFLVFTFARPALRSNAGGAAGTEVEILLLVDDGLNTASETRDGQNIRLVSHAAARILEVGGSTDQASYIPLSHPMKRLTVGSGQFDFIRDRLSNLTPSYWAPRFIDARSESDSVLSQTVRFNREIYFISNFYSPDWDSIDWNEPGETERRFLVTVGPDNIPNYSVENVEIKSAIIQKNSPIEIDALFHNHSDRAVNDALVSVYLEGERIAQASIDVPPNGRITKSFTIFSEKPGNLAGFVKWEDSDDFQIDNRRWFILNIPAQEKILTVVSDPEIKSVLTAVFNSLDAEFIDVAFEDADAWETKPISGYDAVILTDVKRVSAGASERLAEFVQQGGGLILFQNLEADLAGLSRGLWDKLGFSGAKGVIEGGSVSWGKLDLDHPLFTGMFEKNANPRSPHFSFALNLATGKDDQAIIPFSNGSPFLIERKVNNGRALLYSVSLKSSVSDFIFTGIFAPLIIRSAGYVSSSAGDRSFEWETGKNYDVVLPLTDVRTVSLIKPDRETIELSPRPIIGGVEYSIDEITLPGIYEFRRNDKTLARYAANVPIDQSELMRRDMDLVSERLSASEIFQPKDENISDRILSARFGTELWLPLALIFAILLLAESLLGKTWNKND